MDGSNFGGRAMTIPYPPADLQTACEAFTGPQEGLELFMYLDGPGNITVGRGHMLYSPIHAAQAFGVDVSVVQPQWDALKVAAPNKRASDYGPLTTLRLTPVQEQDIFATDISTHIFRCRALIGLFDQFPGPVQVAAVDIDYNTKGGIHTFPRFITAVERGDWATAAFESNRPQLPARSAAVKALIEEVIA